MSHPKPSPDRKEDCADIVTALEIVPAAHHTTLVAVVIDKKDPNANKHRKVPCRSAICFTQGYPYDAIEDAYLMNFVDSLNLGAIPVGFEARMPSVGSWRVQMPVPEAVIKRYLTQQQKESLASYRMKYSDAERYSIEIIQMIASR